MTASSNLPPPVAASGMASTRVMALPVVAVSHAWPDTAHLGFASALQTFCVSEHPTEISLLVDLGGTANVSAHYLVDTLDPTVAESIAGDLRDALHILVPWLRLADPRWIERPRMPPGTRRWQIVGGRGMASVGTPRVSALSALATHGDTVRLLVSTSAVHDDQQVQLQSEVTVWSGGRHGSLAALTVAAEHGGPAPLDAVASTHGPTHPSLLEPLQVARLLALPLRLHGAWPEYPHLPNQEVRGRLLAARPPHVAVFGGSGLGKTTLLTSIVDDLLAAGRRVVVVCLHGDAAYRAANLAARRGAPVDAYDFAHPDNPPRWNVCAAPASVEPEQWAVFLVGLLRSLWPDAPEEYFGPVWRRAFRLALQVLCRDPEGPHPISELLTILSPNPLPPHLALAVERIGDRELASGLDDVRQAIARDKDGNYTSFLVSKLEPFLASPALRRIIDHRVSTVRLDGLAHGRSFVAAVPGSVLGDEGALAVAATILGAVWDLARSHPDVELDVVIDEAHRFPVELLATLLAEGRKFGVRLWLATQSPLRLDPTLLDAVLANCGAIATFRCGPRDAAVLDQQFPTVTTGALQRLPAHTLAVTFADDDLVTATDPPDVDSDETELQRLHRETTARYQPGLTRGAGHSDAALPSFTDAVERFVAQQWTG